MCMVIPVLNESVDKHLMNTNIKHILNESFKVEFSPLNSNNMHTKM